MKINEYFKNIKSNLEPAIVTTVLSAEDIMTKTYIDSFEKEKTVKGTQLAGRWVSESEGYPVRQGHYSRLNITGGFRRSIRFIQVGKSVIAINKATFKGMEYGSKVIENLQKNNIKVFEWKNNNSDKTYFMKQLKNKLK